MHRSAHDKSGGQMQRNKGEMQSSAADKGREKGQRNRAEGK